MFGLFKKKLPLLELKVTAIEDDNYVGRYEFLTTQKFDIEYQRLILGLITKMCAIEKSRLEVTVLIKDYLKNLADINDFNHSTVSYQRPYQIEKIEEGRFPAGKDVVATLIHVSNTQRHINTKIPRSYYEYQMLCTIVVAIELACQKLDVHNLKSLHNGIKYLVNSGKLTSMGIMEASRLQNEAFLLKDKF